MRFIHVAPLVGAWIETDVMQAIINNHLVAPLVGAWIETTPISNVLRSQESLPMWERGLKHLGIKLGLDFVGRSPCGSVD